MTDIEFRLLTQEESDQMEAHMVPYFAWDCHFCAATFGNHDEARLGRSIRRHLKAKHDGWEVDL